VGSLLSDRFRSVGVPAVAFCQMSNGAETVCLSKASVTARSCAGLQPGFISFTPHLAPPMADAKRRKWFVPLRCLYPPTVAKMRTLNTS